MSIYKRSTRASRDRLTGGTRDVNPQFMNMSVTQTANDTYTQVSFPIPIQRLQNTGRAQVMEVLKVFFNTPLINSTAAGVTARSIAVQLTTKSFTSGQPLSEPNLFARYEKEFTNAFTAGGTGILSNEFEPYCFDVTDGAGHGILIASDAIFMAVESTNTSAANSGRIKLLYRWKDVSIQEYVGIVQSQQ